MHAPTPTLSSNRLSTYLPQQQAPPSSFPPPPGSHRDRSGSRTRGVLNTISAIAAKRRVTDNSSPAATLDSFQPTQRSDSSASRAMSSTYTPAPPTVDQALAPQSANRSISVGIVTDPAPISGSRSGSRARNSNWQPGMAVPPPPPGGPPGSRSQSVERGADRNDPAIKSSFASLPQRLMGAPLSPMPATPADWTDEQVPIHGRASGNGNGNAIAVSGDRAYRSNGGNLSMMSAIESSSQPSSQAFRDGFVRMAATRDPSAKGIRDRRLESRARSKEPQTALDPHSDNSWSDEVKPLVLADTSNSTIGRRRHVSKTSSSPRGLGQPITAASALDHPHSAGSTGPHQVSHTQLPMKYLHTAPEPTPPFSPDQFSRAEEPRSAQLPSRSPAPHASPFVGIPSADLANHDKQFQSPIEASPTQGPISAPLPRTHQKQKPDLTLGLSDFAKSSLLRYRAFLDQESAAPEDTDRVELFADFIVAESRIRRDRYAAAFESMTGGDVMDLTRDLWRSNSGARRRGKASATPIDTKVSRATREEDAHQANSSAASSPGDAAFTPSTQGDSPNSFIGHNSRHDSHRQTSFQPQLSPIMSMAQSTVPDEEDSRGRPAGRWWEDGSGNGSISGGGRKIELSKRESKYMGVRNLQQMEWDAEPSPGYGQAGPSSFYHLGSNEYPAEKTGWHDEATPSVMSRFPQTPITPQPPRLDISRLITLPPPYPRHHPAVNNKHPELAPLRATLRDMQHTNEMEESRARFLSQKADAHIDSQAIAERRRDMRKNIQDRVAEGNMSFAEAAAQETAFEDSENRQYKSLAKQNFNGFLSAVLTPVSSLLTEKIATATGSIDSLKNSLLDSASTYNPNATQESGDELPELVEKITLMKWLFEAREQLHKDLYQLQCESDDLYKHVILTPYLITQNTAKISEVDTFFATDGRARDLTFATEVSDRFKDFHATVDESVTRGVEAQLNAFWDIAPSLLEVVEQIPLDAKQLAHFAIQIPGVELDENPTYGEYPMQYLYSLLAHAEKSAYQFIENQVNLCCLLHEVKLGVSSARLKMLQGQREKHCAARGEDVAGIAVETERLRGKEDGRLTKELKERVLVVEDQWRSALGSALEGCRARVGEWLVEMGGWDESLEE